MSTKNVYDAVEQPKEPKVKKPTNEIKDIRSVRQLDRVNLDFDSPRIC